MIQLAFYNMLGVFLRTFGDFRIFFLLARVQFARIKLIKRRDQSLCTFDGFVFIFLANEISICSAALAIASVSPFL